MRPPCSLATGAPHASTIPPAPRPKHRPWARTVDEQHDLSLAVLHLLDHRLQPLLKLAAVPAQQVWNAQL